MLKLVLLTGGLTLLSFFVGVGVGYKLGVMVEQDRNLFTEKGFWA